jgi:hypothetical protein
MEGIYILRNRLRVPSLLGNFVDDGLIHRDRGVVWESYTDLVLAIVYQPFIELTLLVVVRHYCFLRD